MLQIASQSAWSWEQTNIDFYQVVSLTRKTVAIQSIRQRLVRQVGWASEEVEAVPGALFGKSFRRKVNDFGYGPSIRITSYKIADVWDGTPRRASHHA
ncbi:hypothetical protein [Microbacterium invictum]|uniref:Uncharacterized protein n=1 Tax=Microbacterium invictum TaxID=515415 RepID=A0AA40VND6_9MICO|nr:hypothetical protein [Microbacterium invictum]MBB4140792.1 hypothetical protein [Microbacterium invictum]